MKNVLIKKLGSTTFDRINAFVDLDSKDTFVVDTTSVFNIENHVDYCNSIVNIARINNIRFINKFFEKVNAKLNYGDTFVFCVETFSARRNRKKVYKIPFLRKLYAAFEFVFLRIFPKVKGLKTLYFIVTRGRNRILSKAEALGRVSSCGFEIRDYFRSDSVMFVIASKVKEPAFDMSPSYGPLYAMPRLGKNGKMIKVYKFRTMHPYAEYLQEYMIKMHGYADTGKPANDFRVTPWGKFLRKYWLDELPQLINVLKGEMKLVGVRPISKSYSNDIPLDLQKNRVQFKPGCIPPYVSLDRKGSVESVLQAEREYLQEKVSNPYTTDSKYFFSAIFNIIFKNKRSA